MSRISSLDSLRAIFQGDENSSAEVAPMLDGLRNLCHSYGVAALGVDHFPKNDSGFRGSTAIAAAAELWFLLGRAPNDSDRRRRFVECRKSRPAPEAETLWFHISVENDRIELVEAEPPDGSPATGGRDTVPHQLADQILNWMTKQTTGVRRKDIAAAVERPHHDRSVGRAIDQLLLNKAIVRNANLYELQPPSPIAPAVNDRAPENKQTDIGATSLPPADPTSDGSANARRVAPWIA